MPAVTSWSDQKAMVARRSADVGRLLREAQSGDARVAGLDWSVADLGAHLVSIPNRFHRMASGERFSGRSDMVTLNARMIDAVAEHDLEALARRFEAETAALLAALGDDPDAPFDWYDLRVRACDAAGIVLGEYLVHGLDLASTNDEPWPIQRAEALSAIGSVVAVLPEFVNHEAVAGVDATIELRLRGRTPLAITVAHGTAAFHEGPAERPDLTVSADPVAYLLVGYGRSGTLRPVLTGKILAWGRRPWLAARFPKFFLQP